MPMPDKTQRVLANHLWSRSLSAIKNVWMGIRSPSTYASTCMDADELTDVLVCGSIRRNNPRLEFPAVLGLHNDVVGERTLSESWSGATHVVHEDVRTRLHTPILTHANH